MNPSQYSTSFGPSGGNDPSQRRRLMVIVVVAVLVLTGLWLLFGLGGGHPKTQGSGSVSNGKFVITGTAPALKTVTTLTTLIAVNFSQPLAAKSVSVTSSPSIITAADVNGKTLFLSLLAHSLVHSQTYTITITGISDTAGKRLTNQKFSFTPIFDAPSFDGEDSLYDAGLTATQVKAVNGYISEFKPWAAAVAVDPSTVDHHRDDPNDPWSPWDISFTVNIDNVDYLAVTSYGNINSIQLKLLDPATNGQLFVAGNVGNP
jgi:Big-like domain-containing protein